MRSAVPKCSHLGGLWLPTLAWRYPLSPSTRTRKGKGAELAILVSDKRSRDITALPRLSKKPQCASPPLMAFRLYHFSLYGHLTWFYQHLSGVCSAFPTCTAQLTHALKNMFPIQDAMDVFPQCWETVPVFAVLSLNLSLKALHLQLATTLLDYQR